MKKKSLLMILAMFFFCLCIIPAYSQTKLVIITQGKEHPMYNIASKIVAEAYKKAGYDIDIRIFPPLRASLMINNDEVDGYLFGDAEFTKQHPGTVLVQPRIGNDEMVVFTNTVNFKPNGWASLKPYLVGYQTGMAPVENNIKGLKNDGSQTPPQAFEKLMKGRVDVVVLPRVIGLMFKKDYPKIKILSPPLERVALHTVLAKKRAGLAPKLSAALTEMNTNGRIKAITDQVEADLQK